MPKATKGSGAKTSRTETVGVRLEPKIRYLAEMAAREQQRTLSSFIDWAIRRALTPDAMNEDEPTYGTSFSTAVAPPLWMQGLWDIDEADRFYLLAKVRPDLMTADEERRWRELTESNPQVSIKAFRSLWNPPATKGKK